MLSRQPSVSSSIIDLTSDTDSASDDLSPNSFFASLGPSERSTSSGTSASRPPQLQYVAAASHPGGSQTTSSSIKRTPSTAGGLKVSRTTSLLALLEEDRATGGGSQNVSSQHTSPSSTNSTPKAKKRTVTELLSDTESDREVPVPLPKKSKGVRASNTATKGKAVARSASTAKATAAEKEEAKANARRLKEEEKKRNELSKETEKQYKDELARVNKLVAKKEDHIKNFTLHASPSLQSTKFIETISEKLEAYGCRVVYTSERDPTSTANDPGLIRWLRRVDAKFNEHSRIWEPVKPYSRFEATNLIYVRAEDLLSRHDAIELMHSRIQKLRDDLKLTTRHQVFIMIDDMESYYRKKGKGSRAANASAREAGYELVSKQKVERALAQLQVAERCFIVHVEGVVDAAEWIYNITADIGVKPHKLVERSHLPFCPVHTLTMGSGTDNKDTYSKMLQQLKLITEPRAKAVLSMRPTLRSLFEAYEDEPDEEQRALMLRDAVQDYRGDGAVSGKTLNVALSSKIAATFWTYDSLAPLT